MQFLLFQSNEEEKIQMIKTASKLKCTGWTSYETSNISIILRRSKNYGNTLRPFRIHTTFTSIRPYFPFQLFQNIIVLHCSSPPIRIADSLHNITNLSVPTWLIPSPPSTLTTLTSQLLPSWLIPSPPFKGMYAYFLSWIKKIGECSFSTNNTTKSYQGFWQISPSYKDSTNTLAHPIGVKNVRRPFIIQTPR